ncbi:ankyrin repeat domain-containing protein [Nesterenkonia sp. NBAIMH1]|uniref:ankyrin repeat domain-containing protein n=1 Tax=Nesterenkonia sp. NBAIMH1 TaxID=2600320 RepID=UPI0011B84E47|nr:ankyrin repeat domain-containing protein [Nesterenkonia sp. NBAIMH1]
MADQQTPGSPADLTEEQLEFLASMFDLARAGKTEELLSLVDQGIPPNLTNSSGDTLLILAAYHDQAELVRGLLERGAETDRENDRGQTAVGCAVFRQNEEITRLLLEAGADVHRGRQNPYAVIEVFGIEGMRSLLDEYTSS